MDKSRAARSAAVVAATMVVFSSLLVLAACGEKIAEQKIEKEMEKALEAEGKDVDVDIDDESIVITGDDGDSSMSFGGAATVPDDFPQALLPADVDIQSAISSGEGSGSIRQVTFTSSTSSEDMYEWYLEALAKAGYKIEQKMQLDSATGMGFNIWGVGPVDDCNVSGGGDGGEFAYSVLITTK